MDVKKIFGQRLKLLRVERGYTQESLAEQINLNPRQISKIETGDHLPSASTIDKICDTLDVLPHELFTIDNKIQFSRNKELKLIKQVEELISKGKYYNYVQLALNATKDKKSINDLIHTLEGMKIMM